jgi:hypothetical protein
VPDDERDGFRSEGQDRLNNAQNNFEENQNNAPQNGYDQPTNFTDVVDYYVCLWIQIIRNGGLSTPGIFVSFDAFQSALISSLASLLEFVFLH